MSKELGNEIETLLNQRDENTKKKVTRATKGTKKKSAKKLTKKQTQILELANNTVMPDHYFTVWTEEELKDCVDWLGHQNNIHIALDTETFGVESFKDDIVGVSFYAPHKGFYIPIQHIEDINHNEAEREKYQELKEERTPVIGVDYVQCLPRELIIQYLRPLLEDETKKFLLHNAKFDIHIVRNWLDGIRVKAHFDTMIAQALLDENQSKALKDIAPLYLKVEADKYATLFGKTTFDKIPIKINPHTRTGNLASYYAIKDTELTYRMWEFQVRYLKMPRMKKLYDLIFNVEMPFLHIVADAEARGVQLDKEYLETVVAPELHEEVETLRQKIWAYTGEINLNSPAQLSEAVYVKLGIPRVNDKKPNSTDKKTLKKMATISKQVVREAEVLTVEGLAYKKGRATMAVKAVAEAITNLKLRGESRETVTAKIKELFTIADKLATSLLDYRGKVKLATAFADKLPKSAVKGRVHTSFNPVGTKTGRMSCSAPNLQQIPSKVGGLIRNAFIADKGRLLASIDFSQQELRVLAHVSQDEVLLGIYRDGGDVHSMTATGMWNRKHPEEQVTYEQFLFGREMSDLFRDADGNLVEERFTEEFLTELVEKDRLDKAVLSKHGADGLRHWAELGYKFEKVRKDAKVVNFGIIYGMSEQGLADTLEITEQEAVQYIEGYFDAYPGVKAWMADQRKKMDKVLYTETMEGRKRRVYPEMQSGKWWQVQKAYRMGINAIIQGSSADMVKIASIQLQPLLKEIDAHIVLWVHDEIIFDVPEDIGMENLKRIADIMCTALPLDCGLKSDIEVGVKWGQKMSDDEIDGLFDVEDVA